MPQPKRMLATIKKSALLAAALTIPLFFLGAYLFNPHGKHGIEALASLGLVLIYPSALIHDSGWSSSLGTPMAFTLMLAGQYLWTFLPTSLIYALLKHMIGGSHVNV